MKHLYKDFDDMENSLLRSGERFNRDVKFGFVSARIRKSDFKGISIEEDQECVAGKSMEELEKKREAIRAAEKAYLAGDQWMPEEVGRPKSFGRWLGVIDARKADSRYLCHLVIDWLETEVLPKIDKRISKRGK